MVHSAASAPDLSAIHPLAERTFTPALQERFTALSGDRSPIHLAAFAGWPGFPDRPVVHGVHALLWALDDLATALPALAPLASLRVRFEKLVHVGDRLDAVLDKHDTQKLRLNLMRGGERVASIYVVFGDPSPAASRGPAEALALPDEARLLAFDDIPGFAGRLPLPAAAGSLVGQFPSAARWLGAPRVVGLACTSVVVGMICPGARALYAGLDLATIALADDDRDLHVAVSDCDDRFRRVLMSVGGGGWAGTLDTLYRPG